MNVSSEHSPRILLSQEFASFEELAETVVDWNIDFRQSSRNRYATGLEQIRFDDILFTHLSCGCHATHNGATPSDMCTISIPYEDCPPLRFYNRTIDRPALIVSAPGEDFEIAIRPGYAIMNFSIPYGVLDSYCERNFDQPADKIFASIGRVVPMHSPAIRNFKDMTRCLHTQSRVSSCVTNVAKPVQTWDSRLLNGFFQLLNDVEPTTAPRPGAVGVRSVDRALEFIAEQESEPLTVRDLSAAVGISERTLERVFVREFGLTPKQYLTGKRMSGAHRDLWQADPSETHVADVANAWGFWHMGQFAKDYRGFFGELPSETLARA